MHNRFTKWQIESRQWINSNQSLMNIHESIMFYKTELQDMTPGVLDGSTKWWNAAPGLPKQPTPRIAMWTNGLDLGPKMKLWNHMWFLFLRGDDFCRVRFSISPRAYNMWTYDEKQHMRFTLLCNNLLRSICGILPGEGTITWHILPMSTFESMIFRYFPVWWGQMWSVFLELFTTHHSQVGWEAKVPWFFSSAPGFFGWFVPGVQELM